MNFNEKCYSLLRKVPKGKVTTYKSIAHKLNSNAYKLELDQINRK
ncbi:hypothetical protein COU62_00025 [Candidatus Pacearchaeota archaeon CG10_big_fil_rev_8_21_14_0_10_35_219]|nr:MGMT family protein [Candidatus Pacearchaeota archaeon]PIO08528.1 MAG: hypothetical protein COU62_00025 [Candidatus Pacearchaeota archaeon CG10_big_fil_rev_8_21_14_0_10_35_219]PIY81515.1 MAG: hypothetical protein COY79_02120 [Candidatus Pacearchaeota archaeon CG_4_10_14_0_8_um_filter_35_169]PIZ80399.1 MAG: hypothetical protein COY00_00995 [Candidatus Pacearchaeota archaeon CG_4_10_14_0_2_um_filter_35_33]PJA69691.1 MAG: hypothetical protein CO155_03815 [Candidatus Pacearchaeota archaeon CG_4_